MAFDMTTFKQSLTDYINQYVTVSVVDYIGDKQPTGGSDQGVNFDVGEVHSFDLSFTNTGDLGILNLVCEVSCVHGKLSQSFSGPVNMAGMQWVDPWLPAIQVRPFNLSPTSPDSYFLLRHEFSGGSLFGYKIEEPTAGSDNNRKVESLIKARVLSWQADLGNLTIKYGKNDKVPEGTLESFIQRT